ncbi:MAG: DNA mismatch endonuclease Vsr, partial [Saprospirales bacterium]|nr:DNA mismatch endonuclease Vsr [Saprospirales bacterium]
MADVHSAAKRSYNMSRIRSKNTRPEMLVRRFLHGKGLRFRLHKKDLPGKPDIVLPKYKTAIFVQGCFWHGHEGCRYFVVPGTRTKWWLAKINRNKESDKQNITRLQEDGCQVIEVYECELKPKLVEKTLNDLLENV